VNTRGRFGEKVGAALLVSIHADEASAAYHGFVVMKPGWVTGYTDDIAAQSTTLARAMPTSTGRARYADGLARYADGLVGGIRRFLGR